MDGVRFEIPNHLRTLDNITVRYRSWDLSFATVVDNRTCAELATIRPVNKQKNANGARRPLEGGNAASYPEDIKENEQVAPLLLQMLAEYSATGLPPAYLPKESSETKQHSQQNKEQKETDNVTE